MPYITAVVCSVFVTAGHKRGGRELGLPQLGPPPNPHENDKVFHLDYIETLMWSEEKGIIIMISL